MGKRIAIVVVFVLAITSSFYAGSVFLAEDFPTDITEATFLEVMSELMENHYLQPTSDELVEGAIEGMIISLDDPFTTYFDAEEAASYQAGFGETYVGIGVTVRYAEGYLIVESVKDDGPADIAGVRVNDLIAEVDSESVFDLPFYEIVGLIIGDQGTEVTLGIIRNGVTEMIQLTMTRSVIDSATVYVDTFERGDQLIGYIKVTTFGDETMILFVNSLADLETQGIDGLIIDLRDNGGGHLSTVYNMLNQFLVDNEIPMFSAEYYSNGDYQRDFYFATRTEPRGYDIVTLVNENSASASEVFASAMQEHGGYLVVGKTTFGKGTMQRDVSLSTIDGDSLHITIGKWFTSDGNWVHYDGGTDGVTPDIIVDLTDIEKAYKVFLVGDETKIFYDDVDPRVANIQLILNIMGYTVRTDGYYGIATKQAILDIQLTNNILRTGNIDSDTLLIINEALDFYQDQTINDTQLQASIDALLDD
ncbi:MAG: S41 family peptidase [Candidatus Izimaplasma sp.]|nr:S41 family peptidase [Candidatus Izimaplasma bacterium]